MCGIIATALPGADFPPSKRLSPWRKRLFPPGEPFSSGTVRDTTGGRCLSRQDIRYAGKCRISSVPQTRWIIVEERFDKAAEVFSTLRCLYTNQTFVNRQASFPDRDSKIFCSRSVNGNFPQNDESLACPRARTRDIRLGDRRPLTETLPICNAPFDALPLKNHIPGHISCLPAIDHAEV